MTADHDNLVGSILEGRYQVEAELGRGAMGVVYRARHVKVGRKVAIKVLHRRLLESPTAVARFEREARAAARLVHTNLVGVLDIAELPDGRRMTVMEYASGPSLASLIAPGVPMEADRVVRLLRGICDGLEEAHRVGLVHRDLKPENVVIEKDGDGVELPRIIDFGIAVLREPEGGEPARDEARLTEHGLVMGTPAYMAPEQALGEAVDPRCDLFALGVMAFELLTGAVPFDGTGVEIVQQTVAKPIPAMAARAPAGTVIDPRLELVVRKLTARQRDDRFSSAREAREALDALAFDLPRAAAAVALRAQTFSEPTTLGGAAASTSTAAVAVNPGDPRATRRGRRRWPALALGLGLGGAVVGATALTLRADRLDAGAAGRAAATEPPPGPPAGRAMPSTTAASPPANPATPASPTPAMTAGLVGSSAARATASTVSPSTASHPAGAPRPAPASTVPPATPPTPPVERDTSAAAVTARYQQVGKLVAAHPESAAAAAFRRIDLLSSLGSLGKRTAALDALDAIAAER